MCVCVFIDLYVTKSIRGIRYVIGFKTKPLLDLSAAPALTDDLVCWLSALSKVLFGLLMLIVVSLKTVNCPYSSPAKVQLLLL